MRTSPSRKIALAYPASVPWLARVVGGIRRYVQENERDWRLFSSPPVHSGTGESALTIRSLQGWQGDGIILVSNDERELQLAQEIKIPVINLAGGRAEARGIPRVMVDHYLAGQAAAQHLLELGLKHLAFFGWEDIWYSDQRRLGFHSQITDASVTFHSFLKSPRLAESQDWMQGMAEVTEWLASLPKPVGIFAVHDYRAQILMEACQEAGLRIPDDVALIGMDNDEIVCEHSAPTLTSISRSSERVGWEAAALLERLMEGEEAPREDVFLEPDGVVARQSTDKLYCQDPVAQRAVDYMRANLRSQFSVADLASHTAVSKRTLEMRFREEMGVSPHDFLSRLRVKRAQALFLQPQKRTVEQIATECGFGTVPTLYAAFQRISGKSLTDFRKDHPASRKNPLGDNTGANRE
jgi:LacI family transcriptional regulator